MTDLKRISEIEEGLEKFCSTQIERINYQVAFHAELLSIAKSALEKLEQAKEVLSALDKFQKEYHIKTHGGGMPGNEHYCEKLTRIVLRAREVLEGWND